MIAYFSLLFALLLLFYSIATLIIALTEIKVTTDIANRYYWSDRDYETIKSSKRFLFSLFITIPLCIFCFVIFFKTLKPNDKQDYSIHLKNVPKQYMPKIILSDKDTGEIVEEIKI
ncbi:MAG: hypothetical protein IJ341_12725 [Bacteroidales bacterium]|nr:hypothetical protein [Bacteroidales bacterium]